jgi:hypothetical protein
MAPLTLPRPAGERKGERDSRGLYKLPKKLLISVIMGFQGRAMELHFLKTLVIIFGASAFVVFLLQKLKIPSIVGFLVAGAALGPHGFGMILYLIGSKESLAKAFELLESRRRDMGLANNG